MVADGYKQTDVGVIPEDWNTKALSESFKFKNGLNKAKEFFGHGTPIVNYMDVYNNYGLKENDIVGKVEVTGDEQRNYHVKKGDVFFTRTSETVDEIGLSTVVVDEVSNTVFSGFILRARPIDSLYDLAFKKYCFSSKIIRTQIMATSSYTTRALTNGTLLGKIIVPIPPKQEQQAIATALSDTDELINSLEKLIAKKEAIKTGTMQELLTGKKRLDGFSGEWEEKKICEIAEVATGTTPPTSDSSNYGNDYFFVGPVDLGKNKWILKTEKYLSKKGFSLSRVFPSNSILYTCIGSTIGKLGIANRVLTSNQQINAIFPNESYSTSFLYYNLLYQTPKIRNMASEQAVPMINKSDFGEVFLVMPKIDEQLAIATILSDMDSNIEALKAKLSKVKAIKEGMMQELLTGKTRLLEVS